MPDWINLEEFPTSLAPKSAGQGTALRSVPPVVRVPKALEIGDQRWTEVTVRLLTRIDRGIAAEQIEWLLPNTDGAPVGGRAHDARVGEPLDHFSESGVHRERGSDLVADQTALRRVAIRPPFILDELPRQPVAGEARQPEIRHAGDDAFLARRQCEIGVARGEDVIHHQKRLTVAADGEGVERGDPGLFAG